jgi:hypothetical protein
MTPPFEAGTFLRKVRLGMATITGFRPPFEAGTFLRKVRLGTAAITGFRPRFDKVRQKPDRSESGPCHYSDSLSGIRCG